MTAPVAAAGEAGARLICLQELTLLPYCAIERRADSTTGVQPEPREGGPTLAFAREMAAATGAVIHASLY
ncbi:MAG: hydrolase, partial [Solirubrobacterales bacterium]